MYRARRAHRRIMRGMAGGMAGGRGAVGHRNIWPPHSVVNLAKHRPKKGTCILSSLPETKLYTLHTPLSDPTTPRYLSAMDTYPLHHTKWSDRLTFDIALALEGSGEDLDEIKDRHGVTASDLLVFNKDPVFLKRVESYREDIREKGMTFKLKARAQAEELLTTSWGLIHSPNVSPAVKADLIKSTVKWAGLEAKTEETAAGGGGGVKININFGNNTPPMTLTADVEGEAYELDSDDFQ